MTSHDSATLLSLRYLEILERRLSIKIDRNGQPVFIPDRAKKPDLLHLRSELNDLFSNSSINDALNATREFSNSHIQTVGFGLVTDFDLLVKLGLMYGERTVLWDLISSRLLNHDEFTADQKLLIGQVACNLILLKPIIEDGGVVILPHPIQWCELAQLIDEDLREQNNNSLAKYGLSMALSTIDSKIVLHPFTLLSSSQNLDPHIELIDEYEDKYSIENYIFQQAITTVLSDVRFAYLKDVKLSEFFKIISQHSELRRELRTVFSGLSRGFTSQQNDLEIQASIEEIQKKLKNQKKRLAAYVIDGVEASTFITTALITTLSSADFKVKGSIAGGVIVGLSIRLWQALRKWYSTPESPVIVQAFKQLQQESIMEEFQELKSAQVIDSKIISKIEECEIQRLKEKFMSFYWVEERHEFLKELPLPVARKVLDSLDDSEIYQNVNIRQFQEDYIGGYLRELWGISKPSFWHHIKTSFDDAQGILISDSMYQYILYSECMPLDVWDEFLQYVFRTDPDLYESIVGTLYGELFGRIVAFQVTYCPDKNEKRDCFLTLLNAGNNDLRVFALDILNIGFAGELPDWIKPCV